MTERQPVPKAVVAVYNALAAAEAALHELQDAKIPYPNIRMQAHAADDPEFQRLAGADAAPPFWSLNVILDEQESGQVEELLRKHDPITVGWLPDSAVGRSEPDQGAIAWRHYVFHSPAATDETGDSAGTTGMTGIISSGVFATGAHAEGNPPASGLEGGHRPTERDEPPTSDERRPETDTSRSRPETEFKS
jgi:hypothetical protein